MNWVSERSICPKCSHVLGALDLIPVFSWLVFKGECRYCNNPISKRYPFIEICTGFLAVGGYFILGLSIEFLFLLLMIPFLISLLIVDFERMILPNQLVAIIAILGAARLFFLSNSIDVTPYIIAGFLYFFVAWGLRVFLSILLKKEALGFGDVKFFFVVGLWLGIDVFSYFLILSGILAIGIGAVWKWMHGKDAFPFGPALIVSFYALLLFEGSLVV